MWVLPLWVVWRVLGYNRFAVFGLGSVEDALGCF